MIQRDASRLALGAAVVALPWMPFVPFSVLGKANLAGQYALVAISLVLLTGWVGQVSLGQAALVGMGAYVTGIAQGAWHVGFPLNLVFGALAGAGMAALLGTVALRVRGLYLAVSTLIFSWTADVFLFQQEFLTRHSSVTIAPIGQPGSIPYLDFTSRRTFYYAVWAVVAITIVSLSNLRDRKIGRAFFAIRGSEMAAASLGIDVVRTKLTAFAVSGAIAGAAGSLMLVSAQIVTVDQFSFKASLFFLAVAVVGGLTSLYGAVAAGVLFAALEELFFRVPSVGAYLELVSAVLLAVVLLAYPGGLGALGAALRRRMLSLQAIAGARSARSDDSDKPAQADAVADALADDPVEEIPPHEGEWRKRARRLVGALTRPVTRPWQRFQTGVDARRVAGGARFTLELSPTARAEVVEAQTPADDGAPARPRWEDDDFDAPVVVDRQSRPPLIEVDAVTVQFGGLTAANRVTLAVRQGEIVGLIGPNGAGKTTTFNAIAGFVRATTGAVRIHGVDVTNLPVHLRSRLGVARTFQVIQLFPQLSVFDNLLVATSTSDTSGLFASLGLTARSLLEEHRARQRVTEVVELLGLHDVADRSVAGLPFGTLRMVEIARALVTGAPVVMLDEPASGLDDVETARLIKLIRFIRSLGVTILLIEHDVAMVTGISDYIYVLDQGRLIAEGAPDDVQRDPAVVAAYLGEPEADPEAAEPETTGARS